MSSKHFLCCVPVRVAVFITSFLAFVCAALVAGGSFFVLIKFKDGSIQNENDNVVTTTTLTNEAKIALWVAGGVYTVVTLVSLFGFIGSVIRKRSFVALYSTMTYVFFFIQAGMSGYLIFSLFHKNGILKCGIPKENTVTEDCTDVSKNTKIFIIVSLIISLLIQLYIVVVIRRYVHQLDEEQSYNRTSGYVDSAFKMGPTNTAYYPHQPLDQGQGLLAPPGHYPYSDPHHSFGT